MGRRYAIVGFGCAGYHALEALRQSDSQGEIHVFSELDQPPANPMLTTYYAAGRLPYEALFPFGSLEEVERKLSPVLHMDAPVAALEKDERALTLSTGERMAFDAVLLGHRGPAGGAPAGGDGGGAGAVHAHGGRRPPPAAAAGGRRCALGHGDRRVHGGHQDRGAVPGGGHRLHPGRPGGAGCSPWRPCRRVRRDPAAAGAAGGGPALRRGGDESGGERPAR